MDARPNSAGAWTLRAISPLRYLIGFVLPFCRDRNGYSMASLLSRHGGSTALTVKISSWTTSPMPKRTSARDTPRAKPHFRAIFAVDNVGVSRAAKHGVSRAAKHGV